jgi:SAM-dependent methyltransferase
MRYENSASHGSDLRLPPKDALVRIGNSDPLPYYYKPVIGRIYIERLNMGLRRLPAHCESILEVGYGSGLLMPTLSARAKEVVGIDIHKVDAQVQACLDRLGVRPRLVSGDARNLPFEDSRFDAVIALSFMEHVKPVERFIDEMWRVLKPGGKMVIGMPMVNKAFNMLFPLIGYFQIDDQHITSPGDVRAELRRRNWSWNEEGMPSWAPSFLRAYTIFEVAKLA